MQRIAELQQFIADFGKVLARAAPCRLGTS